MQPKIKHYLETLNAVHDMGDFRNTFVKNEPIFDWSCLKNSGTSQHKLFQHCIGGIKRIEIK